MGTGMNEGAVVKWLKAVGDPVTAGKPRVDNATAKSTQEPDAPASGLLAEILLQKSEDAEVRTPIAVIEAA